MNYLLLVSKLKDYLKLIREMPYGTTVHEMDLELKKERGHLDHLSSPIF